MELIELIQLINRYKWLIIGVTLGAMVLAAFTSFFLLTPVYESSTTLMVNRSDDGSKGQVVDYATVMANLQLVKTYGEIAKSRTVAEAVIKRLNLDLTPEEFSNLITVQPLKDTQLIEIKVQNTDPKMAAVIANTVAEEFIKKVSSVMKIENVKVVDPAAVPDKPIKPKKLLNTAVSGVVALILILGIVLLLEQLDYTFKTPDDIEKYLELSVLGAVPSFEVETKRKGQKRKSKLMEE